MPSINISESDFIVVANAALDSYYKGDEEEADALDKIARKINASLTNAETRKLAAPFRHKAITWEEIPSVLETVKEREKK